MFRGDQLLDLRSSLLQRMVQKMSQTYPLNDKKINGLLEGVVESLIGKLHLCKQ